MSKFIAQTDVTLEVQNEDKDIEKYGLVRGYVHDWKKLDDYTTSSSCIGIAKEIIAIEYKNWLAQNIIIRKAVSRDIPYICKIIEQLTPSTPHNYQGAVQKFERKIQASPDYYLWVAESNGVILGTAMMHLQHKLSYHCGTAAHLEDVVVHKNVRGLKIGDALVKKAIETAKSHDCYKIMLSCYAKTVPYYESFGFQQHDIGMRLTLKELYPS